MEILIRKEPNGSIYIDRKAKDFQRLKMDQPPYNFIKIEVDDKYSDFQITDFNDDLTFSVEKYQSRKQKTVAVQRIAELKQLLANEDYKTIKYVQGKLTDEEFAKVTAQCDAWREEINKLESNSV